MGGLGKLLGGITSFASVLFAPLMYMLYTLFWGILVSLPFLLIHGLFKAAKFFGFDLINIIIFGKTDATISFKNLPFAFIAFAIYSLFFFFVFMMVALIRYSSKGKDVNSQKRLRKVFAQSGKALLFIVLIPFAMFLINFLSAILFDFADKALTTGDNTSSIASKIYMSINNNAPFTHSSINGTFSPPSLDTFMADNLSNLAGSGITLLKSAIIGWFVLIFLGSILVNVVQKSLQQLSLLVLAPIVGAKSIDDEGKALVAWKEQYVETTLSIFINLLSLQFYSLFISLVIPPIQKQFANNAFNGVLQLVAFIGAAAAAKGLNKLISALLNINISSGDGWKNVRRIASSALRFGTAAVTAGSAVASGGTTLAATAAKGGAANVLGGLIGKGINAVKVGTNRRIASGLGMTKAFTKQVFEKVGANKVKEQRDALNKLVKAGTSSSGEFNKSAMKNIDSLRQFQNEEILKQNHLDNVVNSRVQNEIKKHDTLGGMGNKEEREKLFKNFQEKSQQSHELERIKRKSILDDLNELDKNKEDD